MVACSNTSKTSFPHGSTKSQKRGNATLPQTTKDLFLGTAVGVLIASRLCQIRCNKPGLHIGCSTPCPRWAHVGLALDSGRGQSKAANSGGKNHAQLVTKVCFLPVINGVMGPLVKNGSFYMGNWG